MIIGAPAVWNHSSLNVESTAVIAALKSVQELVTDTIDPTTHTTVCFVIKEGFYPSIFLFSYFFFHFL